MKRCDHTHWLALCSSQGGEHCLVVSDRSQKIAGQIPNPDHQTPSLITLIGNVVKSTALRHVFGVRRIRRSAVKRGKGEIHLHVDPSTYFNERPILVAEGDLPSNTSAAANIPLDKCHEVTRRPIKRPNENFGPDRTAESLYFDLLFPFTDVYCFFCDDLGGLKQIARRLAAWLEGPSMVPPGSTHPRVVVVTEKIPPGAQSEDDARMTLLWLVRQETTKNLSERISGVDVIAPFPNGVISVDSHHRLLKERLMKASDTVRNDRAASRWLFSVTHFTAFLKHACEHFTDLIEPFDFIKASRVHYPVASDLSEHLSNFLKNITSSDKLINFAAPFIASSFLLDNYPPDAHRMSPILFRALPRSSTLLHAPSRSFTLFHALSPSFTLFHPLS